MHGFANCLKEFKSSQRYPIDSLGFQIGIPLVILAVMLFLNWFQFVILGRLSIDFSWITIAALLAVYATIDLRDGIVTATFLLLLKLIASIMGGHAPTMGGLLLFVLCAGGGFAAILYEMRQNKEATDWGALALLALVSPMILTERWLKRAGL